MRLFLFAALAAAIALPAGWALPAAAQQLADADADLRVAAPAFAAGTGPRLVIDGGHHNFHTVDGRFAPFAAVVRNDGFQVSGSTTPLTAESLRDVQVLVIANALDASNDKGRWTLPTPSALKPEEIAAVKTWVEGGGGLLLIADHMPFAGAAQDLAQAFGFSFSNGFVQRDAPKRPDIFSKADGTLKADVVTEGIDSLRTFTGSAFTAPAGARPILVLPKGYVSRETRVAWEFDHDTTIVDVEGQLQGAVMTVGRGRIAVFGEGAMFSAQVAGPDRRRMGFNAPDAPNNKPFFLRLVRWLAGALPAA
ncbi:DUF4350 domain-containing protein [Caulobacter sp. NIBR1757]|uniref:DUF4350 domain-containing protein n=1 Tax=Caulobacter sp. NIBR1757 TaxID=3016000 RepID=UPI0022EFFD91|nr:DUF4350 domain-containing protein [Caulobacter sp. NIBR1757]WGM40450.1 hypothetical protein AMEJIAPC_03395 [Caulobacter sp. NIBR1757]